MIKDCQKVLERMPHEKLYGNESITANFCQVLDQLYHDDPTKLMKLQSKIAHCECHHMHFGKCEMTPVHDIAFGYRDFIAATKKFDFAPHIEGDVKFASVELMYDKFTIPFPDSIQLLDKEVSDFRGNCLQEEVQEFSEACSKNNLDDACDAMVDLIVFAMGTLNMMGVDNKSFTMMFDEVMKKNLQKERAKSATDERGTRGNSLDLVKPKDFIPASHQKIIDQYNKLGND